MGTFYILFDLDNEMTSDVVKSGVFPDIIMITDDPNDIWNYALDEWGYDEEDFPDFNTLYKEINANPMEFEAFIQIIKVP